VSQKLPASLPPNQHTAAVRNPTSSLQLPTRNKTSWMYPRSRHWHLIDYVLVRQQDRRDIRVTKSVCGAECWTDHRLILCKLKFIIFRKHRPQGKGKRRLAVSKLDDLQTRVSLSTKISEALENIPVNEDIDKSWESLRNAIYNTILETLGLQTPKNKDWFEENSARIQQLLNEKQKSHIDAINTPTPSRLYALQQAKRKVQKEIRALKDSWLSKRADEIQGYADTHDMKNFYKAIPELYDPSPSFSTQALLSVDGTSLIADKKEVLDRWSQHFDSVLNRQSSINEESIGKLPQFLMSNPLDEEPSLKEVQEAIKQMS